MNGNARSAGWGVVIVTVWLAVPVAAWAGEFLGTLSANPLDPDSVSNPLGTFGSPLSPRSIHNPNGVYGNPNSNRSATNPHATKAPRLYDQKGRFRGTLSANPLDPDSVNNPMGRYGNPLSPDSIHNPLGAGNPLSADSPTNPLGTGWTIRSPD